MLGEITRNFVHLPLLSEAGLVAKAAEGVNALRTGHVRSRGVVLCAQRGVLRRQTQTPRQRIGDAPTTAVM